MSAWLNFSTVTDKMTARRFDMKQRDHPHTLPMSGHIVADVLNYDTAPATNLDEGPV